MKNVLIISPYFVPLNTPDMQRVRMSLAYFEQYGWSAEVVAVDTRHADVNRDPLLAAGIPASTVIHHVGAMPKKLTMRLGLGSIALRSLWHYRVYVDRLLRQKKFDLVFFSTTQFPVCILGRRWKKKFNVPYLIDMQDPWHSEFYRDKPPAERPKKYWFSYRLNKFLEPIAMRTAGGLMSVSGAYVADLVARYPELSGKPSAVIPFGASEDDIRIAKSHVPALQPGFDRPPGKVYLVYAGRGGHDMLAAADLLFEAIRDGLAESPAKYGKLNVRFIGTSYAAGPARPLFAELARTRQADVCVNERTERIGYYESIVSLLDADAILILGSDDLTYNASKISLSLLTGRPLLAIIPGAGMMNRIAGQGRVVAPLDDPGLAKITVRKFLDQLLDGVLEQPGITKPPGALTANAMTAQECALFNQVIQYARSED